MTSSHSTAVRGIARSALVVMVGLVLSSVVGLLRSILVTKAFGTSAVYDAFSTANRLPDLLFNLMAGGALASAFIPTYTGFLVVEKREEADRLASAIGSWIFILLASGAALCALFAPPLVRYILAPGYVDHPEKLQTTISLLRILLLCPTVFGISGLVMGILNAHHRFFFSALAPMFYALGWIAGVLFLVPSMGIYGLAWGVVSGAVLHLAVQLPALFSLRSQFRFSLPVSNPAVRNVVRLMAPRIIGQSAVQFNFLVNTILSSSLSVGSLSAIGWAFQLMLMPEIAIAQASATASFPTLSAQVSRGEIGPMRSTLVSILRGVFFLALPASIGLMILAKPIVRMVFERGSFDSHSTELVVWALEFYAAGLAAHSLVEVLTRAYFALQDTITPVMVSVGGMVINVVLSLILLGAFSAAGWMPHGALALANTLATAVEMTVLIVFLRRKLQRLLDRDGWLSLARTVFSAAVMAAALVFWAQVLHFESKWIAGLGGISVGLIIYGGVSLAIGSQEARSTLRTVVARMQSVVS
ncbi:MAG: murein biosynthesis integral membrane protein MurJ [Anaerolineales bacterium]